MMLSLLFQETQEPVLWQQMCPDRYKQSLSKVPKQIPEALRLLNS